MILAFDIGNTTTTIGVLEGCRVILAWRIVTRERTSDEYKHCIISVLNEANADIGAISLVGASCVVPSESAEVSRAARELFGKEAVMISANIDCGVRIVTKNPSEVGADRIANAVGAFYIYGGPTIVIDMGTATTFDLISQDGNYRGGVIAPGIVAGARDLWERARMLPVVEIKKPRTVIGETTIECMQSGIFYGCVGQIEGIVRRMWDSLGKRCRVVMTGGHSSLVKDCLSFEVVHDPDLTLKGIAYAIEPKLRQRISRNL